jgi:hypothetical protein
MVCENETPVERGEHDFVIGLRARSAGLCPPRSRSLVLPLLTSLNPTLAVTERATSIV